MFVKEVICTRACKCDDQNCEHKVPHKIEYWQENGTPMDCTMIDNCNGHEIWCDPVCSFIDFNIDKDFEL